jgi:sodium transport system permease protein
MTLSNVKLIFAREVRDQLRDRRTLFMIAVLPILLYPLLGMSLLQISQFMREQPTRVLVVGAEGLNESPPLFSSGRFSDDLFPDESKVRLLDLTFAPAKPPAEAGAIDDARTDAFCRVQSGMYEAALYFPPDFASQLDAFRETIRQRAESRLTGSNDAGEEVSSKVPRPEVLYSTANDKSQITFARLFEVLRRWTEQIGDANLTASGVPTAASRPFGVDSTDVAHDTGHRGAAVWSKILPVLLLLWALTGAFYPAIDLCAGEKERGTLETLLSSPAQRSEIVLGKLATIMLFSAVTAVLNLVSVGVTGWLALVQVPGFGMPPLTAIAALAVALLPISALFSALCLALAALARSTKEGQYYLMPLLLVIMPLVVLPMSPGVELNLGNSLIPVTGVVLLLRSVLEGNYWQVLQYSPVVVGVTLLACLLSIRWAVDQFNSESVLFRESERLDVGLWVRHLLHDRRPTPVVAAAACCGVLILMVRFFLSMSLAGPSDFVSFVETTLAMQLAAIAMPALLMTVMLTSSPRQTLLLKWPPLATLVAAAMLAVALHPLANVLQTVVQQLYPVSDSIKPALEKIHEMLHQASFWPLVLVFAVVPAIFEEIAFRGFILSGFRHLGHKWRAIVLTALLFGLTHGILQQSLIASLLGVLLGYLAVQTGSILPCMVFHAVHNALALANYRITAGMIPEWPLVRKCITLPEGGGCLFDWPLVVVGLLVAVLLLFWFSRFEWPRSQEEELEAAIERGEHEASPLDALDASDAACNV